MDPGVNARPPPQPDPATPALLRGAQRRLAVPKSAQPRPPCAGCAAAALGWAREARPVWGWGLRCGQRCCLGVSDRKLLSAGQAPAGGEPPEPYRPAQAAWHAHHTPRHRSSSPSSRSPSFLLLAGLLLPAWRAGIPASQGLPGASSPGPLGCHPGWGVQGRGFPGEG